MVQKQSSPNLPMANTLQKGDIAKIEVNDIVNAANTSLLGGGSVDGAIHRVEGMDLLEDCMRVRARQGHYKVEEVATTIRKNLPCKHVVHTVWPHRNDGNSNEPTVQTNCYPHILLTQEPGSPKTPIPSISTGFYRLPKEAAGQIVLKAVNRFKSRLPEKVVFVCFDDENHDIYNHH